MKKLALATLVATIASGGALSAALAGGNPYTDYSPTTSWSGTFVGVNIGGVGGDIDGTTIDGALSIGGQVGVQVQNGNFVYGGVLDYDVTELDAGGTNYEWTGLGSARFKLGVPVQENFLVYGTAGLATAHSWGDDFDMDFGLTGGVGVDYRLSSDTVIGAEYQYTNFGDINGDDADVHAVKLKWQYFMPN